MISLGAVIGLREGGSKTHQDQFQARDHQKNLVPGARAEKCVAGKFREVALVIAPPPNAARPGSTDIRSREPHGLGAEDSLAVPITAAQHKPSDARGRPSSEGSAAPGTDQRQAVHRGSLAVARRPLCIGNADGP